MTDKEIREAFERCVSASDADTIDACKGCPLDEECGKDCDALLKKCLDLINRQKAMIKMLNTNCENLQLKYENAVNEAKFLKRQLKMARTEAVKEVADEFMRSISGIFHCADMQIIREKMKDVAEQMKNNN